MVLGTITKYPGFLYLVALPYSTHGFNFMIVQENCLISSHHIHILTSRKKEKVRVKESIPFSYGNF